MAADSTLGGALRGAGDTRFPLLTVIVGFYVARLGFAWAGGARARRSASPGCGARCSATTWCAPLLKGWRFHSGVWKRARV